MKLSLVISMFSLSMYQQEDDPAELWHDAIMKVAQCMEKSKSWLEESSKGKDLTKDIDRISKMIDGDTQDLKPETVVKKTMEQSVKNQRKTIALINTLIKLVLKDDEVDPPDLPDSEPVDPNDHPGGGATNPYSPNRSSPPSPFKNRGWITGRWGELPLKLEDTIQDQKMDIDKCPPEWREKLKQYFDSFDGKKEDRE